MEELGFVNLDLDAGLFKCFNEASQTFIIVVVYVDDAIFLGPSKAAVKVMKKRFMERWESRDLGELKVSRGYARTYCCPTRGIVLGFSMVGMVGVEQTRGQRQTGRNDLPGKGERIA